MLVIKRKEEKEKNKEQRTRRKDYLTPDSGLQDK